MITRCPECRYMMIAETGCRNCGFSYFPKEANDQKDNASVSRKVERSTGAVIMPAPAVQLSLNLF